MSGETSLARLAARRGSYNKNRRSRRRTPVLGKNHLAWRMQSAATLSQERFVQAAVDRDDLAGGFAEAFGDEEEVGFRLVGRRDR